MRCVLHKKNRSSQRRYVFAFVNLFLVFLVLQNAYAESESDIRELPPMTIFVTRGEGDQIIQRSEVEWRLSNDFTITMEPDGSYTASDRTNSYSLKSLLESLGNPTVNFDISYAKNSVSMTADGRSVVSTMTDTINHLDVNTTLLLTPVNLPVQDNKDITKRRIDSLSKVLASRTNIKLKIKPSKILQVKGPRLKKVNYWRVQIQREL